MMSDTCDPLTPLALALRKLDSRLAAPVSIPVMFAESTSPPRGCTIPPMSCPIRTSCWSLPCHSPAILVSFHISKYLMYGYRLVSAVMKAIRFASLPVPSALMSLGASQEPLWIVHFGSFGIVAKHWGVLAMV